MKKIFQDIEREKILIKKDPFYFMRSSFSADIGARDNLVKLRLLKYKDERMITGYPIIPYSQESAEELEKAILSGKMQKKKTLF